MAKNISLLGASYTDVPAVTLPQTGGGTASFTDITDTTATASDVLAPKVFYSANGVRTVGTGTGGAVSSVNGQTGDVVLDAEDVGALPDTTVIPVQSVNGMTGDVVVPDPFMLLDFSQIIDVSIPSCLNDIANTSIPNVDVSITDELGAEWAIASIAKYEVFDAETGGNRINVFPVCMFSMNRQKTLRMRMMAAGPNAKTAKLIRGAILLKHR